MNIVLFEPEIPQNTGNIARTCAATNTRLHLIKPFGFSIDDKYLKRAGLDYWDKLNVAVYENFEEFLVKNTIANIYMATTKALNTYANVKYSMNDYIMFGKESAGIPEEILVNYPKNSIRIPMLEDIRSLNLANSVGIVLYEALRQNNFDGLEGKGNLHRLSW
ncbi:MAG TPA: tRNA (uridine(34)/cytosine(34)/5-carboxymethylaminomethyluridine(34)-2'-O)-methyltransferase TrmL [Clostridiales bacterium]|nr:MAG: tRNA (uridine(34)/cytosine(34)/5-carboxymethylaminomethyluridine(34)-2'-O)-methyltransferase TrmL [Clostridiales bacterium GWD2_32_19]HCC07540.1 tRNA (uridine(34)/cytosine(34)/5-carboxymethylaminomethyluridine(34)-2'-O)-methyltransferase TrmL [Clostridiales bacterium]